MVRIIVAVVIAVAISALTTHQMAPSKAELAEVADRNEQGIAALGSEIADAANDIGTNAGAINTLEGRLSATEADLEDMADTVTSHTGEIETLELRVTDVEDDLETVVATPPEGWLTGNFTLYTLHAKASKTGNYTANVNLVYTTPVGVGNVTTYDGTVQAFYASVNWTGASVRDYVCVPTYNNATWGISQVRFNIGTFNLTAKTEKTVAVPFGGLNSSYEPDFAYVEVYPVYRQ